jgi:hypothetical protein
VQVQQPEVRPGKTAAWRLCKGSRRQVAAVLSEMKWWYTLNQIVTSGDVPMAEADTTESLKHWLLATAPAVEQTFAQLENPASALLDRISLQRLRTYGKRVDFLLMHSRQRGHRLLVLRVATGKTSRDQRWEHARKQATYQDDRTTMREGTTAQACECSGSCGALPVGGGLGLSGADARPMLLKERPAQYFL